MSDDWLISRPTDSTFSYFSKSTKTNDRRGRTGGLGGEGGEARGEGDFCKDFILIGQRFHFFDFHFDFIFVFIFLFVPPNAMLTSFLSPFPSPSLARIECKIEVGWGRGLVGRHTRYIF